MDEVKEIPAFLAGTKLSTPEDLAWAFPTVPPGIEPLGGRVIVQLRRVSSKLTNWGFQITSETKETEKWNVMVGKVIALGPLAFKNRDTLQPWPEGVWVGVGDFVRVPKWGGDRWEVKPPGAKSNEEPVLFMTLNDHEIIGRVVGDPLSFKAYL
jgi:co-chaperonin GroES (HSP10)